MIVNQGLDKLAWGVDGFPTKGLKGVAGIVNTVYWMGEEGPPSHPQGFAQAWIPQCHRGGRVVLEP